jgi:folate-binding protein YgfZ
MLSNDLRDLKTFDGQYAALLTQQGKVVADVRVLCAMNSFYVDFWEFLKEKVVGHLDRYLIADEVEIADRSDDYATVSLQGPQSETLLRALVGEVDLPRQPAGHVMGNVAGAAVCVVAASHTDETGFDLILPKADMTGIARRLDECGGPFSARWVGVAAQEILRIEAGIPLYGLDFSEDHLMLEVGLEHAVSFNKGCYLGQEVVERIRSRGHVNKKLCGLLIEGEAAARHGDAIKVESKDIGRITSSVVSPRLRRPIALGYVHRDYWAPGSLVSIGPLGHRATVSALPFPQPS